MSNIQWFLLIMIVALLAGGVAGELVKSALILSGGY